MLSHPYRFFKTARTNIKSSLDAARAFLAQGETFLSERCRPL